ncbi:DUF2244 domain-containing protein [Jannaschia formosa]|uniref:DUF2244 domain-containing protein n=1 Tax=Jannaschia formosa TaxID=2259592 RepID=UPI000E1BD218|nr:DUF2244 domain-containing protein [Jannaschia formosa]TFL18169.1 DUF2244 domain-containing protein [Jannaschia formosa]
MPIRVITDLTEAPASPGASESPLLAIELWPHQSLTPQGFVVMIGATFAMLMVPLIGLIGTAVLWGVLPFMMLVLGALWYGLKRSWRDRDILERFELSAQCARLTRRDPDGSTRDWEANTLWLRVERHDRVGTVEDYLTLLGGSRPVEIGAFLTPEERRGLERRLLNALGVVKLGV